MEPVELDGDWWLPESPDRRAPGQLRIDADGQAELNLRGSLRHPFAEYERSTDSNGITTLVPPDETRSSGVYPTIYGAARGEAVSLQDSFQTSISVQLLDRSATERIHVHQVFRGAWLPPEIHPRFVRARFWMDWLVYWTGRSGLRRIEVDDQPADHDQLPAVEIRAEVLPAIEFRIPSGTASLTQALAPGGDRVASAKVDQDFFFDVRFDQPADLDEVLEIGGCLQSLVSIGTGQVAAYQKVELFLSESPSDGGRPLSLELIARWNAQNQVPVTTLRRDQQWFGLDDLGGSVGLERRCEVAARHRSTLARISAIRYSPAMYASDRLLNAVASLEGYDKAHDDSRPTSGRGTGRQLAARLKRCADKAGPTFHQIAPRPARLVEALRRAREAVAHHNSEIESGALAHHFLSEAAFWLYVLCLMRDCGMSDEALDRMMDRGAIRRLRRDLIEVIK